MLYWRGAAQAAAQTQLDDSAKNVNRMTLIRDDVRRKQHFGVTRCCKIVTIWFVKLANIFMDSRRQTYTQYLIIYLFVLCSDAMGRININASSLLALGSPPLVCLFVCFLHKDTSFSENATDGQLNRMSKPSRRFWVDRAGGSLLAPIPFTQTCGISGHRTALRWKLRCIVLHCDNKANRLWNMFIDV